MTLVDEFDEHGARQCLYTPAGDQDDAELRWARLIAEHMDDVRAPPRSRGPCDRGGPEPPG